MGGPGRLTSQLPFGWVCFSNLLAAQISSARWVSQLPLGWVFFSNCHSARKYAIPSKFQLPFGWVCFSNPIIPGIMDEHWEIVSIAFRLGLFLYPRPFRCASARRDEVSIAFRLGLFL